MARERVNLRLDADLKAWAEGYAAERRWTFTTVVEAGLEALRGDAVGGVPASPRRAASEVARAPAQDYRWERQQRLNAEKERKR